MGRDSWAGIREKVFPSLVKKRRIVMTKKRPDNLDENAIYIQIRPSEFKMRRIGKPGVEKNFLEIYSKKEFVFPELGNLSPDVDLLDSDVRDGTCKAFYSIGDYGRQFSNINLITREILRDNGGRLEYMS